MLKRGIQKWDLVLLVINSIIGAGIFGLPSRIFGLSGSWSLLAFFVCAIAVMMFIFCFAEVSSRFDKTGGPYLYTMEAFGGLPAFLTGWLLLLSRIFNYATLINLIVIYLSFFSPFFQNQLTRMLCIFSITAFLSFINYIGVKNSARLSNIFTVAKLVPLTIFIIAGLITIQPELIDFSSAPAISSFSTSVLLLIFAFGGFESVLINSGEIINPKKNLPFALIISATAVTIIYCLIQLVCIGNLPTLSTSQKPLADAAVHSMGIEGGYLIAAGACISIFGTLNAIMLGGSRLPFAFSNENQFPKLFSYIDPKHSTPLWSLLLFSVIVTCVSLAWSFLAALTIGAIIRVMVYSMVCISMLRLRKKQPGIDLFHVRHGYLLGASALIVSAWLLSASKITEIRDVAICAAIGLIIYGLQLSSNRTNRKRKHTIE